MWHLANDYIRTNIFPDVGTKPPEKKVVLAYKFSSYDTKLVLKALQEDASSYLYSSIISFLDALQGLKAGFYSWPTVKLYYSIFYSCRASLASHKICLFYVGRSAFSVNLNGNNIPLSQGGNTHQAVLELYRSSMPLSSFLAQEIDQEKPFEWFAYKREYCNYKQPKFCEPTIPAYFNKIDSIGAKSCLTAYNNDTNLYLFDKDHAIVSYPYALILETIKEFSHVGINLDEPELQHLRNNLRDLGLPESLFELDFSSLV